MVLRSANLRYKEVEMTGPAYPAARGVASKVWEHFERHTREARDRGERGLASVPDAMTIEAMIDAAF